MPYSAVPLNKDPVGTFIVLKTFFSAREQLSGGAREQKQILKTDLRRQMFIN